MPVCLNAGKPLGEQDQRILMVGIHVLHDVALVLSQRIGLRFGVMGWVTASDYSQAHSDPLAEHKNDIMQHMNADHKDALILIAKRFAGIEAQEAAMTSVDRLGFHLRLKTQDGVKGTRVAFLREVSDGSQTREAFVEMVKQARE